MATDEQRGRALLSRLIDQQLISQDLHAQIAARWNRSDEHVIEMLLASKELEESEFLSQIAAIYKTRYIATSKLARARVTSETTRLIPRRFCTQLRCFPVLYRPAEQELVLVAADLEASIPDALRRVSGSVGKYNVMIARPRAVRAAIAKHYDGKSDAFSELLREVAEVKRARPAQSPPTFGAAPSVVNLGSMDDVIKASQASQVQSSPRVTRANHGESVAQKANAQQARSPNPQQIAAQKAPPHNVRRSSAVETSSKPTTAGSPTGLPSPKGLSTDALLSVVRALISLIESKRGALRSHSLKVARFCRLIARQLGLDAAECQAIELAGYLHDLGKGSTFHLTPINVARFEKHQEEAKKHYLAPLTMLGVADLPETTRGAVTHLYERFDGSGFPEGLSGKAIPLGARILAMIVTYTELTRYDRNAFQKCLAPSEALSRMRESKLFDDEIIDVFARATGELPMSAGECVLVVDPDADHTTTLDLRLTGAGFLVEVERDMKSALAVIESKSVACVITEVDLAGGDGFLLAEAIRRRTRTVPVLFLTSRGDGAYVERAYALGAVDYVVKPASADALAAKVSMVAGGSSRTLAGNFRDMSMAAVLQAVGASRNSGRILVTSGGFEGEVHLKGGEVWNAVFGNIPGEEAVYRMLMLKAGEFEFDSTFQPAFRAIDDSLEELLLEGMRRVDEQ